jgi:hypothetical protein
MRRIELQMISVRDICQQRRVEWMCIYRWLRKREGERERKREGEREGYR